MLTPKCETVKSQPYPLDGVALVADARDRYSTRADRLVTPFVDVGVPFYVDDYAWSAGAHALSREHREIGDAPVTDRDTRILSTSAGCVGSPPQCFRLLLRLRWRPSQMERLAIGEEARWSPVWRMPLDECGKVQFTTSMATRTQISYPPALATGNRVV